MLQSESYIRTEMQKLQNNTTRGMQDCFALVTMDVVYWLGFHLLQKEREQVDGFALGLKDSE